MAEIADIVAYICANYPHPQELSKARLTKMVYLADWRSALRHNRTMTDINWVFNHYGPYVEDVIEAAREDDWLEVRQTTNHYGDPKEVVELKRGRPAPSLTDEEREDIDKVIELTSKKYWKDFINLVYSTFPVVNSQRYQKMDLVKLAKLFKKVRSKE